MAKIICIGGREHENLVDDPGRLGVGASTREMISATRNRATRCERLCAMASSGVHMFLTT